MAFCEKCKKKIEDKYSLCDDCLCEEMNIIFTEQDELKPEEVVEKQKNHPTTVPDDM